MPPTDSQDTFVVPEGHRINIYKATPMPSIRRSSGGAWVVHLGILSSDALAEELDHVLAEVEKAVDGPQPQILLAMAQGTLSSLMAPADPKLVPITGLIVWSLDVAALAGSPDAPTLVQKLLRQLHRNTCASIPQFVFVLNGDTPPARAVVTLIQELGIEIRTPDPKDMSVLADVHRPEGIILSALVGSPYDMAPTSKAWAREVNQAKDQAAGNREKLEQLEKDELLHLAERLAPGGRAQITPVDRAPNLRRLLLAVAEDNSAAAKTALHIELRSREIPLLFMVDPKTGGVSLRSWPGGFKALAVYTDKLSLFATARDLGLDLDAVGIADVKPTELFAWAASQGFAVAICVFAEAGKPIYVRISAEDLAAMEE